MNKRIKKKLFFLDNNFVIPSSMYKARDKHKLRKTCKRLTRIANSTHYLKSIKHVLMSNDVNYIMSLYDKDWVN